MRNLKPFLSILALLFFFSSCTKEFNQVEVVMHLNNYVGIHAHVPYPIEYAIKGDKIDSIGLFANDEMVSVQKIPEKEIIYLAENSGRYDMQMIVFHHSGLETKSEAVSLLVDEYSKPNLKLMIRSHSGSYSFSIGDSLQITVESTEYYFNLYSIQQIHMYINDNDLGIAEDVPFIFQTPKITQAVNHVFYEIIDRNNLVFTYEEDIFALQ